MTREPGKDWTKGRKAMLIRDVPFLLKDGRKALLRSPREEDIPGLLNYLVVSAGESDFILRYPEECGKYTPEGEAQWIQNKNASQNAAALVCTTLSELLHHWVMTNLYSFPFVIPAPESAALGMVYEKVSTAPA